LSFRASPSAFAPASLIPLSADTPEWGDPNTNSAIHSQWATLPTGNRNNRNNRNNRTRYMVVLIVVLHNPTLNSPTSGVLHTLQQQQPGNTNHRRNQDYSTFQIQRQRTQRGVVLQSVTQRLRSSFADSTVCRHTRVVTHRT
jgi:hypothetical protein